MFRSGTTLFSKALDAHSKITVVDDPFFQFFKSFRNEVFNNLGYRDFDKNYPVSDNFFSNYLDANKHIRNSNLKIPFKNTSLEEVKDNIKPFCEYYCPELVPLLKDVEAEDYSEFFEKLLNLGKRVYGNPGVEFVGCKNTFSEQFVSPLINTYPNIKIIQIVRDPRAVIASQNKSKDGCYPLMFALRQWRKSMAYALENVGKKDNFLLVRYEDFVDNPEKEARRICSFLGVDYEEKMVDVGAYRGKKGEEWKQNSSFGSSQEITKKFSEKWREILNEKQVQFVEDLCDVEMKSFGYERVTENNVFGSIMNPPEFDLNVQEWIRQYEGDFEINEKEMNKELIRHLSLNRSSGLDSDLLERIFVVENFLNKIKDFSLNI